MRARSDVLDFVLAFPFVLPSSSETTTTILQGARKKAREKFPRDVFEQMHDARIADGFFHVED